MTDLSPAAQAVKDAFDSKWAGTRHQALIAALRAAADQVVPQEPLHHGDQRWQFERDARQHCRLQFLAIAAELEGSQ